MDLRAIAEPAVASGLEGGAALGALARDATLTTADPTAVTAVSAVLGADAAVDAAAVAAAFEHFNRVVDGTGLPVGRATRKRDGDIVDTLDLGRFPHAYHGA